MKKETDITDEKLYKEPSEEQLQQEIEEIQKKRLIYQKEMAEEVSEYYKEELVRRRKKMFSVTKAAVVVLVAGIGLFAFSLTSEATRMWWLQKVERLIGTESGHVVDNDENRVLSETSDLAAIADIKEKTGIPMPELCYEPEGFVFDGYEYDEVIGRGNMYYIYKENVIMIQAYTADEDTAYSWQYDGEVLSEEYIETEYGSVRLREIKSASDQEASSVAVWNYHNHQYRIAGKIPAMELKKIILNFFY